MTSGPKAGANNTAGPLQLGRQLLTTANVSVSSTQSRPSLPAAWFCCHQPDNFIATTVSRIRSPSQQFSPFLTLSARP
ncbi:hypothetical protein FJTKL_05332 [Diaporthe vaccinii]|uniref:Uncharacterized protein n=1 Tax=Diaporthe vaccinii TaxID=105482 RepID=A0ABR4FFG5_9PEZI